MLGSLRSLGSCWQLWWPDWRISTWQEPDAHTWLLSLRPCLHEVSHRPLMRHPGTHSGPIHPSQTVSPFPGSTNTSQQLCFCSSNSSAPGDCPGPQTQGIGSTCLSSCSSICSLQLSVKVNAEYFYNQQAQSSPSQHFHHNCWETHSVLWSMPPYRGGQKPVSLLKMVFGVGNMVLLIPWSCMPADKPEQLSQAPK